MVSGLRACSLVVVAVALAGGGAAGAFSPGRTARGPEQGRRPALVLEDAPGPRAETRHLVAMSQGPARVGADGRAVLLVAVSPGARMHVYAADVRGYVPFTLALEPAAGVTAGRVTYPKAEAYVFPPTGESSKVYIRPFTVTQVVTVTPALRTHLASGATVDVVLALRYQACDDTLCYRPDTARLTVSLTRE